MSLDRASVDAMVAETRKTFGPVDYLQCPCDFENRRTQLGNVNINGVINCCQAVSEDMVGRGTGSVVNMHSALGLSAMAA